jgi:ribonuclease HII
MIRLQMISRVIETAHAARLDAPVCGIDEAGRGPIAGPVVAAAVILPPDFVLPGLNDSKKISARRREIMAESLHEHALTALGICSEKEIDELNILHATMLAMRRACESLARKPAFALIDGNRIPEKLPCPAEALVKGDGREACIAAASIIAKTHRDKIMCDLAVTYPGYGFERHSGYPTMAHVEALQRLGPTPVHRRTFRPVREMFT